MTFNTQHCLNFLEQRVDYDIMAKAINDIGADIVSLNEMYSSCEGSIFPNQTEKLSALTSLKNFYFAKAIDSLPEGIYGNGLLSRYKILSAETILIPDPNPRKFKDYYETRCILKAKLENGYTVLVCHFGLNSDEQENAVKTVVENLEGEKCILMGDFNVTPDNEVLNPIKEKMLDASVGFCQNTPTFPSDKPRIKIDYIFVSPDITVEYAQIPEIIASDHRTHIAVIK